MSGSSALDDYLEAKRREFIGTSGEELGACDALRLREDLESLDKRMERQLVDSDDDKRVLPRYGRCSPGRRGTNSGCLPGRRISATSPSSSPA